jgi:hypothetical protein
MTELDNSQVQPSPTGEVDGLREWVWQQLGKFAARRLLTWLATGLVAVGALMPESQGSFISGKVEIVAGILLEVGMALWGIILLLGNGKLLGKAVKADPEASLHEIKTNAKPVVNWSRLHELQQPASPPTDTHPLTFHVRNITEPLPPLPSYELPTPLQHVDAFVPISVEPDAGQSSDDTEVTNAE